MQIVSTAWNVKSCFLGNKKKKNNEFVVCWIYSPDNGKFDTREHQVLCPYARHFILVT